MRILHIYCKKHFLVSENNTLILEYSIDYRSDISQLPADQIAQSGAKIFTFGTLHIQETMQKESGRPLSFVIYKPLTRPQTPKANQRVDSSLHVLKMFLRGCQTTLDNGEANHFLGQKLPSSTLPILMESRWKETSLELSILH